MSGGGIIGSLGRVLSYVLVLGLVAAIITVVVVAFLQPRWHAEAAEPQEMVTSAFRSMTDTVRSAFGYQRGGVAVGRAVAGVDPPSVAERLAAAASQHVITPGQEVVMTGTACNSDCLGGGNEVMLEVRNDIGADQLDISYAFENLIASGESPSASVPVPARPIKVASCGPLSVIKQCIPVPPQGRGVRLHTLAYYYESADSTVTPPKLASIREEARTLAALLNTDELKAVGKIDLLASAFIPVVA